ncbi:MAG: sulfotransferase [Acidimicrobiia bacterium]|nr:sulfotransferase [Acidimicrobiia bacterium]
MSEAPGSTFADRVVFVLGSRRSGTTWLAELLLSHPALVGVDVLEVGEGDLHPRETVIFDALGEVWANVHNADGEGICTLFPPEAAVAAIRQFCERMFALGRERYGPTASWFVEKTPSHIFKLPFLAAIYPDAWYIHLIRDGRDVARSLARSPMGPDDVAGAAGEWVRGLEQAERHRWRLRRFRQLRYEGLLADPVGQTSDLLAWLGLDVDEEVTGRLSERATRAVATYGSTAPVGAGKWRLLSPRDQAQIRVVAGDWLSELGYLDGSGDA